MATLTDRTLEMSAVHVVKNEKGDPHLDSPSLTPLAGQCTRTQKILKKTRLLQ